MSITIDLPPELEHKLTIEASQLNLSLSEYILQILGRKDIVINQPKTGAELVNYWQKQGVLHSCTDVTNSQEKARDLRHQAETRVQF